MSICPSDFFSAQILATLQKFNILIITGETGSGKTTRIPLYVYFSNLLMEKSLICSQPRRIAVTSVAKRVAFEASKTLGIEIGYLIRFENITSKNTKMKFTTEGLLLKEFIFSPCMDKYSMIIIDEAHERSLNIDLILSLMKCLIEIRNDVKIIITSATLEINKYSTFFDYSPVFCIPGRSFSVKAFFTKTRKKNFLNACLISLVSLIQQFSRGDILVFLRGKKDIDYIGHHLDYWKKKKSSKEGLLIVPIFSGLPLNLQFSKLDSIKNPRKIILATNVAETSLTIPNVSFVLDSGLMKHQIFDPKNLSGSLVSTHIGKINAIQRKGRAGRLGPGKCFRLYTKWSFQNEMNMIPTPEVKKIELSNVILFLKVLGIEDASSLDWIDFPEKFSLLFSFEILYLLKALGKNGKITNLGRKIAEFPVNPMLAKTIILGREFNHEKEIISIVSLLLIPFTSYQSFFQNKEKKDNPHFSSKISDHIFLGKIFQKWENSGFSLQWCFKKKIDFKSMRLSVDIKSQLSRIGKKFPKIFILHSQKKKILDIIISGFFLNFATLKVNGFYKPLFCRKSLVAEIYFKSLFSFSKQIPFIICFNELFNSTKPYLRVVSPVDKLILKQFC